MSARRALVYLLVAVGAACRAPQIAAERRYPAGTPFRAQYLVVEIR